MSIVAMETFNQTLAWSVGALVVKNAVLHLAVVRARLATYQVNQAIAPESERKKWDIPAVFDIFRYAFGSNLGGFGCNEGDLNRFLQMENNIAQNEPFHLLLCFAWPLAAGSIPAWAPTALTAYVYTRTAHLFIFTVVKRQPWRAIAWVSGVLIDVAIAYNILTSKA